MKPFTAACIQMSSVDDVDANIRLATPLVDHAVDLGAQLVLLPENAFAMEAPGEKPKGVFTQENHPGLAWAREAAQRYRVCLLVGSIAIIVDGSGKRANRSLLIDQTGAIIAQYDKIHLFDVSLENGESYAESARILPGNACALPATPWGRMGMTICYDVRFPQLYRALAKGGASFFAVPAAFTHTTGLAHWHVLLRARAIEHGCFVFAPAQCGTHPGGRRTYGHSLIIDPWGRVLAEASETEPGVIVASIHPEMVEKVRRQLPSLQHDRTFRPPEV